MVNYIAKNVLLQDIDTKEYLIPYTENKLPIGTIIPCLCSSSWTPQGTLPLDGAEYSSTQFPSLWSNYLIASTTEDSDTPTGNSRLVTCTYTEYASDIATYGQCAKFAIDTTNNKFKVPLIKDGSYIAQAKSDSELGKCYNESLPNITGYIKGSITENSNPQAGGAFNINHTYDSGDRVGQANWTSKGVDFNASRSSSTYQDNAKVQGDNVRLRWFVVVANGTVSQSAMDWSAWATSLNGKLNKDHSNDEKPYITEVSDESLMPSWYRVWSDGWCEQGGVVTNTSGRQTVTLLKPYSDGNYNVQQTILDATANGNLQPFTEAIQSRRSGSFTIYCDSSILRRMWRACGYMSSGGTTSGGSLVPGKT